MFWEKWNLFTLMLIFLFELYSIIKLYFQHIPQVNLPKQLHQEWNNGFLILKTKFEGLFKFFCKKTSRRKSKAPKTDY